MIREICRCAGCGDAFGAEVPEGSKPPSRCPTCRKISSRAYSRKYRNTWHRLPEGMVGARQKGSFLGGLALMHQGQVGEQFQVSSRAVQQCERRALRKMWQELRKDPAALVEIDEDFARRQLSPTEFEQGKRAAKATRISIGPRLLNQDQREEFAFWVRLAEEYDADGQPDVAGQIKEEIRDLLRRVSSIPDESLSHNFG